MPIVSTILKIFQFRRKNLFAQKLWFPDHVNFWKSVKNCGREPKKKIGRPKKTLHILKI